jgi:hypothetical protein
MFHPAPWVEQNILFTAYEEEDSLLNVTDKFTQITDP